MNMTEDRIKSLMNEGYITRVVEPSELADLTEAQLIEKGYITMVGIFDGIDDTNEELPEVPEEVAPTEVDPDDAPIVDEGEEEPQE